MIIFWLEADPGFPVGGGANPSGECVNIRFCQNFQKNCMKLRTINQEFDVCALVVFLVFTLLVLQWHFITFQYQNWVSTTKQALVCLLLANLKIQKNHECLHLCLQGALHVKTFVVKMREHETRVCSEAIWRRKYFDVSVWVVDKFCLFSLTLWIIT